MDLFYEHMGNGSPRKRKMKLGQGRRHREKLVKLRDRFYAAKSAEEKEAVKAKLLKVLPLQFPVDEYLKAVRRG